jgi:hypothetical protein
MTTDASATPPWKPFSAPTLPGELDRKKVPTDGPGAHQPRSVRRRDPRRRAAEVVLHRGVPDPDLVDAADADGRHRAGVYDRILVDKILPLLRDPKRWDVTVFKYPLQKNQNYVKRIGGMPGDRLRIAGGNLYQVIDEGRQAQLPRLRKPDDLQANMWKNVLPLRSAIRGQSRLLGNTLTGAPGRAFREDDAAITVTLESSRAMLYFRDPDDGGVLDRVWDGYPEAVARAIRDVNRIDLPPRSYPTCDSPRTSRRAARSPNWRSRSTWCDPATTGWCSPWW